jgi:Tfp pilus assembly protein PilO
MVIPELHPRSIIFIIICLFGVVGVGLLGIYPNYKALAELDQDITQLNEDIKQQEILSPVVNQLIQKAKPLDTKGLSLPNGPKVPKQSFEEIEALLDDIAKQSNLVVVHIAPDERSLTADSRHLVINCSVQGDFFDFRKMLLKMGNVSNLENMEQIQIQTQEGAKMMRLRLVFVQG